MRATAHLTFDRIRFDHAKDLHLVVELRAPAIDWQRRRQPLCIVPVVDVSGSMRGDKLHYARQSVMKLVDHLAPGDLCGLLAFSDEVETLAPPLEMTQARKDALRALAGQLEPRGQTNFAGGLVEALAHLNRLQLPEGMVRRAVMFTDGRANAGVATAASDLLRLLDANLGKATVSAFGYGEDADQDLLRQLAAKAGGNYAFVQGPEDALTAFARELGGLLSVHARDVRLDLRPSPGVELTDVVSDVDAATEVGAIRIRIPDLLSDEVRRLVVGLRVDPVAAPGPATILVVDGRYQVVDPDRTEALEERFEVPVELQRVQPGEEQREPRPEVDEVVALAQVVRAQIEAEERAGQGDFAMAEAVMGELLRSLQARGRDAAAQACARVKEAVADRAAYRSTAGFRTSLKAGVTRGARGSKHRGAEEVLGRAGVQLSTTAQDELASRFHRDGETDKPPASGALKPGPQPSSRADPKSAARTTTRRRSRRW